MSRTSRMVLRLAICILITLHIVHVDSTDLSAAFDAMVPAKSKQVEIAAISIPSNYRTLARSTVCNMTTAFPELKLLPNPWSCPKAQNVTWCDFTGVVCRPAGSAGKPYIITELKLTTSNIKGTIPSALGNLNFGLISMVMDSNRISGTIPSQLGNLLTLTAMYLQKNSLLGTVPLALTKLTNLKIFNVNYNYMTGTLPKWFITRNITNNVTSNAPATNVLWTPKPTGQPTNRPTSMPLNSPRPTRSPTKSPSKAPTLSPTSAPTLAPSAAPSTSRAPTLAPTNAPSTAPSAEPSKAAEAAAASKALPEGEIAAAVVMSIVGAALMGYFVYKCFIEEDDEEDLPAGEGGDKKANKDGVEINARL